MKKIINLIVFLIIITLTYINTLYALPPGTCQSDPSCANEDWWRIYNCSTHKCGSGSVLLECAKCEPK